MGNAPRELAAEAERLRETRLNERRRRLTEETERTRFRYYCSLCLIVRDENEYLEEWLKVHIAQGVEHFYVYDHGSRKPVKEFVLSLGEEIAEKTEVIDWSGRHGDAQPEAYNDCLRRARGVSRWVGFIDADEHIRVKTGQSLPDFLRGYEDYAGLYVIWVTYGANGQVKRTDAPLRERFTKISENDAWAKRVGKLIAQPLYMEDMVVHSGGAAEGFFIADEKNRRIKNYLLAADDPSRDKICLDHYYTKSYEEWKNKLARGSAHAKFSRKYDDFFAVNPEMEFCRESVGILQEYEKFDQRR